MKLNLIRPIIIGVMCLGMNSYLSCSDKNINDDNELNPGTTSLVYYIDSENGNDANPGFSEDSAWKSLSMIDSIELLPGDTIKFKRGSSFQSTLFINDSGEDNKYIVLTSYGDSNDHAPLFTNTVFNPDEDQYGNCIRLKGDYIIVENLYFEHTVAELRGNLGFPVMWELGAIYIDKTARHCIVRNNEIFDCGVGIKSYGAYALITNNYIHDCNRILKEWTWGPIAIWLGGDYQEVSYNTIINYSVVDPRISWGPNSYGGGADGGAIEIDDGREPKSNIEIHHNYTRDNQGFIEVTWTDLVQNPPYTNFSIHHNISDDYQQFIALWCGSGCRIENNTVIRRKKNATDWGVFNLTQYNGKNYVRNNLVIVEKDIEIFPGGSQQSSNANSIISNNLFFAASGELNFGVEGPGNNSINSDPLLTNYENAQGPDDFSLSASSPAVNSGLNLGYSIDFHGTTIPQDGLPDIGAFEF
jgi:hypothetical protein